MTMKPNRLLGIATLLLAAACGGDSDDSGTGGAAGAGGSGGAGGSHTEPPRCGDSRVNQAEEECDRSIVPSSCSEHGFPLGTIGCTATCTFDLSRCRDENGNNPVREDCATPGDEDGNGLADCDDPRCTQLFDCPVCGNGILQAGEECEGTPSARCADFGFELGATACTSECLVDSGACRNPRCGDGVREGSELCDDGNGIERDGCSNACEIEGDDCSSLIVLDSVWDESAGYWHATIDMTGFRSDFTPSCPVAWSTRDAVASFTAPGAGTWELSVDILGSPAVIWAWTGTCDVPETQLACGISDEGARTFVAGQLEAGETIHFAVAGAIAGRELGLVTLNAMPLVCGDGLKTRAEACDDGNTVDGDGCSAACLRETASRGR